MNTSIEEGLKTIGCGLLFVFGGAIAGGAGAGPVSLLLYLPGILLLLGGAIIAVQAAQAVNDFVPPPTPAFSPPTAVRILEAGLTIEEVQSFSPREFQTWVLERLGGTPNARGSWDMGIDGFLADGTPVQVKQSPRVSRPKIDEFETAIRRDRKTRGVMVAFSFSPGTLREAARARAEDGIEVELIEVRALLESIEATSWTEN